MNTRQQQRSVVRQYGPIFAASLFTAMVMWPWVLGRVMNIVVGVLIIVFIVVEFL